MIEVDKIRDCGISLKSSTVKTYEDTILDLQKFNSILNSNLSKGITREMSSDGPIYVLNDVYIKEAYDQVMEETKKINKDLTKFKILYPVSDYKDCLIVEWKESSDFKNSCFKIMNATHVGMHKVKMIIKKNGYYAMYTKSINRERRSNWGTGPRQKIVFDTTEDQIFEKEKLLIDFIRNCKEFRTENNKIYEEEMLKVNPSLKPKIAPTLEVILNNEEIGSFLDDKKSKLGASITLVEMNGLFNCLHVEIKNTKYLDIEITDRYSFGYGTENIFVMNTPVLDMDIFKTVLVEFNSYIAEKNSNLHNSYNSTNSNSNTLQDDNSTTFKYKLIKGKNK